MSIVAWQTILRKMFIAEAICSNTCGHIGSAGKHWDFSVLTSEAMHGLLCI